MSAIPKWIPLAFLTISFLGFIDATYLTISHYAHVALPCTITFGCEVVTTSPYSVVFGVPVALTGALYYLAIFFGAATYRETKNALLLRGISLFTIAGLGASAWFVFAQLVLIKAICQYCMVSALTSTALFILGMYTLRVLKTSGSVPSPHEAPSEQL